MIQIAMTMLKEIPGFQAYFVSDLLFRAKTTLTWLAGDKEASKELTIKTLFTSAGNKHILDPFNLLYLTNLILELEFLDIDEKFVSTLVKLFEITLSYALLFRSERDYHVSLELLRSSKQLLNQLE